MTGPALTLSASTVKAGGSLTATGDCMGITANVVPHVYVFRVIGQVPPAIYDDHVEGTIESDGSFEIAITIAPGAPPGRYLASVGCTFDGDQVFSGDDVGFEVTPGDEIPTTTTAVTANTLVVTTSTTAPEPAPADPIEVSPSYTG